MPAQEEPRFELTAIPSGTIALTAPSHHYTTLYLNPADIPALIAALQELAGIPPPPPPHEAVATNAGYLLNDWTEAWDAYKPTYPSHRAAYSAGFAAGWHALRKRLDAAHATDTTENREKRP